MRLMVQKRKPIFLQFSTFQACNMCFLFLCMWGEFYLRYKKKKHIQHNHVIIVIFLCTLPKVPVAVTATLAWHWKTATSICAERLEDGIGNDTWKLINHQQHIYIHKNFTAPIDYTMLYVVYVFVTVVYKLCTYDVVWVMIRMYVQNITVQVTTVNQSYYMENVFIILCVGLLQVMFCFVCYDFISFYVFKFYNWNQIL